MKHKFSRTSPYQPDLIQRELTQEELIRDRHNSLQASRSFCQSSLVKDHSARAASVSTRNSDAFEKSQAKSFIQTPARS